MPDTGKAYFFGLAAVLFWSTVATAFKFALRYLDHLQLLFYATLASVISLAIILVIQKKLPLVLTCSKSQFLQAFGLGFLNPFLYYVVLFKAYDLLPAQEAQPINYTWALMLMFLSIPILKQKIRIKDILAGVVGYSGVLVISTHGHPLKLSFSDPLGVTLALFSSIIWAFYWIYNKKSELDPVVGLFLQFSFALPLIIVTCAVFSNLAVKNMTGIIWAVYVGLFEMGITFVIWLMALKVSVNTARVGNLIFISPFLSLIFIHFILGEVILPSTFLGLIVIMASVLLQRYASSNSR